jgi:predicted transcriptional regulator
MMNPQDPTYQQMGYYLNQLKGELDAAWSAFSGKCIYFPARR